MVSLVDIGPAIGSVAVRGHTVEVNGLTAAHIVGVLISFPEVRKILANKSADLSILIAQAPLAVSRMIAAGTGKADDEATIKAADALPVGEQYEIMKKVFEITFPKGLESLLEGVEAALKATGAPGWEAAMKSPALSNGASPQEETSGTAGTPPPGNSQPGANS